MFLREGNGTFYLLLHLSISSRFLSVTHTHNKPDFPKSWMFHHTEQSIRFIAVIDQVSQAGIVALQTPEIIFAQEP
jgi:hypothetical protein